MKVWYILMTFPAPTETFVANDVRALTRLGIQISVHAFRGPRPDAEILLRERGLEDVRVTHATAITFLCGLGAAIFRPITALQMIVWLIRQSGGRITHFAKSLALLPRAFSLLAHLEREPPDVVHIYWGHYPSIFGWLVMKRDPDVVISLSLSAYDLLRAFPGSAAVARRADMVSTWSAANLRAISSLGVPIDSVYVSWQGIDIAQVENRKFHKIPRRVVTAGRLIAEKGMDDVLRAFAKIVSTHADARLTILGEGPDRNRLERLAENLGVAELVEFRGHVAHADVFEELSRAELFLFLSSYRGERIPNVVKEAMACRCLVITTDTPGIEEIIDDGVHARIVRQGAWQDAAAAAIAALGNCDNANPMVAAAGEARTREIQFDAADAALVSKWEHQLAHRHNDKESFERLRVGEDRDDLESR